MRIPVMTKNKNTLHFPTLPWKHGAEGAFWGVSYREAWCDIWRNIHSPTHPLRGVTKALWCRANQREWHAVNQVGRLSAVWQKGFFRRLTLWQAGHSLTVRGLKPALPRWQSPWLLRHPADTDQVQRKNSCFTRRPTEQQRNYAFTGWMTEEWYPISDVRTVS